MADVLRASGFAGPQDPGQDTPLFGQSLGPIPGVGAGTLSLNPIPSLSTVTCDSLLRGQADLLL